MDNSQFWSKVQEFAEQMASEELDFDGASGLGDSNGGGWHAPVRPPDTPAHNLLLASPMSLAASAVPKSFVTPAIDRRLEDITNSTNSVTPNGGGRAMTREMLTSFEKPTNGKGISQQNLATSSEVNTGSTARAAEYTASLRTVTSMQSGGVTGTSDYFSALGDSNISPKTQGGAPALSVAGSDELLGNLLEVERRMKEQAETIRVLEADKVALLEAAKVVEAKVATQEQLAQQSTELQVLLERERVAHATVRNRLCVAEAAATEASSRHVAELDRVGQELCDVRTKLTQVSMQSEASASENAVLRGRLAAAEAEAEANRTARATAAAARSECEILSDAQEHLLLREQMLKEEVCELRRSQAGADATIARLEAELQTARATAEEATASLTCAKDDRVLLNEASVKLGVAERELSRLHNVESESQRVSGEAEANAALLRSQISSMQVEITGVQQLRNSLTEAEIARDAAIERATIAEAFRESAEAELAAARSAEATALERCCAAEEAVAVLPSLSPVVSHTNLRRTPPKSSDVKCGVIDGTDDDGSLTANQDQDTNPTEVTLLRADLDATRAMYASATSRLAVVAGERAEALRRLEGRLSIHAQLAQGCTALADASKELVEVVRGSPMDGNDSLIGSQMDESFGLGGWESPTRAIGCGQVEDLTVIVKALRSMQSSKHGDDSLDACDASADNNGTASRRAELTTAALGAEMQMLVATTSAVENATRAVRRGATLARVLASKTRSDTSSLFLGGQSSSGIGGAGRDKQALTALSGAISRSYGRALRFAEAAKSIQLIGLESTTGASHHPSTVT